MNSNINPKKIGENKKDEAKINESKNTKIIENISETKN